MTVQVETRKKTFTGSGTTGPFTWTWRFLDNDHITVTLINIATQQRTILTEGDDYTLTGALSYSGGSLTTVAAVSVGEELEVKRTTPKTQEVDLRNQGDFFPETYEEALDALAMGLQDTKGDLEDLESYQQTESLNAAIQAAAQSADDAEASAQSIVGDVAAAAASAAAASSSAGSASSSATASQTARTGAETAQGLAETAQSAAETAETNAETAQTAAETAQAIAEGASAGLVNGLMGYATKALLDADLVPGDGQMAYVSNDATDSNNGYYIKSGATGTGSWVQSSFDRVAVIEQTAAFPDSQGFLRYPINPIVYEHPRGDSELYDGSNYYSNTAQALWELYPTGVTFDQVELYVRLASASATGTLELYETSSNPASVGTPWNITAETLLYSEVIDTSDWYGTISLKQLKLTEQVSVAAGKYLVICLKSAGGIWLARWTSDPFADRHTVYFGSNFAAMSRGSAPTYMAGSFRLLNNGVSGNNTIRLDAHDIEIATLQQEVAAAGDYYRYGESYDDSTIIGNQPYGSGYLCGWEFEAVGAISFNAIVANVYSPTQDIEWRIYEFTKAVDPSFNPTVETPIASGTILTADFPHTGGANVIPLEKVTIADGMWGVILFKTATGSSLSFGSQAYDVANTRGGFIFAVTPSGSAWPTLLSRGAHAPTYNYDMTDFRLLMQLEELQLAVFPASAVGFDPAATTLAATDTQSALEELDSKVETVGPQTARVFVGDELTAVVGDTTQVFHKSILEKPVVGKNEIKANCDIGKNYPRMFEVLPVSGDVGTHTLTLTHQANDQSTIDEEVVDLVVVENTGSPASVVNVMCVGDSLMAGGVWATEFFRRLTEAGGSPAGLSLSNINFVGNNANGDAKWVGYGGWTWATYQASTATAYWATCTHTKTNADQKQVFTDSAMNTWILETIEAGRIKFIVSGHTSAMPAAPDTLTYVSGGVDTNNVSYTAIEAEAATPFWDPVGDVFDFTYFVETSQGETGLDVVYVLLGWNGLPNGASEIADHASQIGYARSFIDELHADYPSCEVRILGIQMPCPNGGLGINYGAASQYSHYYDLFRAANSLNMAYQSLANEAAYSAFTRYIPVAPVFDSEWNMQNTTRAVNTRNSTTEYFGLNGVHPDTEGYYQIADAAFRDFIRSFCSA